MAAPSMAMNTAPSALASPSHIDHSRDIGSRLRPLAMADCNAAQALSRAVGWPHTTEDWQLALACGQGWAAMEQRALVGTAIQWCWGAHHATLGMVIVSPDWQGRGLGWRLMQAVLESLEERSILLHASPISRGLYDRLGFQAGNTYAQHQGIVRVVERMALPSGDRLRPALGEDLTRLGALDEAASGMPREPVVRRLVQHHPTMVLERAGAVVGFSVLRLFGRGAAIGPVVAPDAAGAQALIACWTERHPDTFLRVDIDASAGLADWLAQRGLAGQSAPVIEMTRGPAIARGARRGGFALISQAIG